MKLYLLRHGPARDKETWAPRPDSERPLTKAGEKRVKKVAKGMRRAEYSFDAILTSPYVRARQTAEIAAKVLGQTKKLSTCPALRPNGDLSEVVDELVNHLQDWQDVLLVGHEPFLGQFLSLLTTGRISNAFPFKKSGLALLDAEFLRYGRCATLLFLAQPHQIA